jgi:hypothetical protein
MEKSDDDGLPVITLTVSRQDVLASMPPFQENKEYSGRS